MGFLLCVLVPRLHVSATMCRTRYSPAYPCVGITPNCCLRPRSSLLTHCSTNLPFATRKIFIAESVTCLPVGGMRDHSRTGANYCASRKLRLLLFWNGLHKFPYSNEEYSSINNPATFTPIYAPIIVPNPGKITVPTTAPTFAPARWLAATPTTLPPIAPPAAPALSAAALLISIGELW